MALQKYWTARTHHSSLLTRVTVLPKDYGVMLSVTSRESGPDVEVAAQGLTLLAPGFSPIGRKQS